MVEMKSTWLGCDEQTPQQPAVSFEDRQREWMITHYPRLWQALEQLETQPIKWRTYRRDAMTRGQELKQLLKLHHQARGILLLLDEDGSYQAELIEKDRIINQLEWELKTSTDVELNREINLNEPPPIHRTEAVACGH